jgi:hypothetical protein
MARFRAVSHRKGPYTMKLRLKIRLSVIIDQGGGECITYHRIDYYWNKVLGITTTDGRLKYPTLCKLIKNVLIIPHGNADVERGFSINENLVSENRSNLSDTSINGLRSTYDAVKFAGNGASHKARIWFSHVDLIDAIS